MSTQPKPFAITRDVQGYPSSGTQTARPFAEFTQTVLLTTNTAKAVTVPLSSTSRMVAYFAFSDAQTVFISPAASPTLAVPTGTVTQSISEILLNGSGRNVIGGQALQLLSPGTTVYVTISYYSIYN